MREWKFQEGYFVLRQDYKKGEKGAKPVHGHGKLVKTATSFLKIY